MKRSRKGLGGVIGTVRVLSRDFGLEWSKREAVSLGA